MRIMNENTLNLICNYINQYIEENNGESPTLTNIVKHTGMVKSTVYRYVLELKNRGEILYSGKNTLGISEQYKKKVLFSRVPILGVIPCGPPENYGEEISGYVAIPNEWVDGECYLLRASGDSMIDADIEDKDLVLIKVASEAHNGQIVAVLTDDGTTLKRYMKDENDARPWLKAENSTYPDNQSNLYPSKIQVLGIALKVIKDIE